jgi:hypothetical protein
LKKKLSNDETLYFIWISIKSDLEAGFCIYLDCDYISFRNDDFHYHCTNLKCKAIHNYNMFCDYGEYCVQCIDQYDNDFVEY